MNEDRLKRALGELAPPGEAEARERGLRVTMAAYEQRRRSSRPPLTRLLPTLAGVTLLAAALLLTPAGASVRDWIGSTVHVGAPPTEPALRDIPGGGSLLLQAGDGLWVVSPDGSRRRLGEYDAATWSPHGLYVAAARGRTLSAIEPDGTARWSLSAAVRVADPRWSPSGFRIAYRDGTDLAVVSGDGTEAHTLARGAAPVPPAWLPLGAHVLAYATADGRIEIADADSGRRLGTAEAAADLIGLEWSPDGSRLLELTPTAMRIRPVAFAKLAGAARIGAPGVARPSRGGRFVAAAFSPDGDWIGAVVGFAPGDAGSGRSALALIDPGGERRPQSLLTVPGRLNSLAWSPDGTRLLSGWPDGDQWLFVPAGRGRLRTIGDVAAQFAPGEAPGSGAFPQVSGWCCAGVAAP